MRNEKIDKMSKTNVGKLISVFSKTLKFGCIIFTLYMISHFFYEYWLNEDATRVTQVRDWQKEFFPSIALCLMSKENTGLYKKNYIQDTLGLTKKKFKAILLGTHKV